LIGSIQRCDRGGFWRKVDPDGVPLYLKELILKVPRLSPWDKVVVLSAFRCYRLFSSPVKPDLSTIALPPKEGVEEDQVQVCLRIMSSFHILGKGLHFKDVKFQSNIDHIRSFSPGAIKLSG